MWLLICDKISEVICYCLKVHAASRQQKRGDMQETEQVVQADGLILILTVVSIIFSSYPYLCILSAGLLLIVFTVRSLTEEPGRLLFAVQVCLSAAFAVLVGGVWACLIFYECRFFRRIWPQIFMPSLACCLIQAVKRDLVLPEVILSAIILNLVSAVVALGEYLMMSYLSAKTQNDKAVSIAAVNEMYEKKLNRELVIKNYLTDKNARLEERETISRNIHNSVGHSITTAIMTLDAADLLFEKNPNQAREKLNAANRRIRTGLEAIRHAVRVLDEENESIFAGDFLQELNDLIDSFIMDTTVQVYQDYDDFPDSLQIPREHTEFITGAVQELLTNGVRHGRADCFRIRLMGDSGHICLVVQDNGSSSFSEENREERIREGFGLKKLIAYVERCGGNIVFCNENGFRTEITLPINEPYVD